MLEERSYQAKPESALPGTLTFVPRVCYAAKLAVTISRIDVYREGLEFTLSIFSKEALGDFGLSRAITHPHNARTDSSVGTDNRLVVTVEFPNGTQVSNRSSRRPPAEGKPGFIIESGGHGGSAHFHQRYWVSPLPSIGEMHLKFEWAEYGIAEQVVTLSAQELRECAQSSIQIWRSESP